jgi:hypothetical protein
MENIINKLNKTEEDEVIWNTWTLEETKKLLEIYLIITKKEEKIFDLIYNFHVCDSWEEMFRDYDMNYLKNKVTGVELAINEIIAINDSLIEIEKRVKKKQNEKNNM